MTVQVTESTKLFTGNGTNGPFTWTWRFMSNDHITVTRISDSTITILQETTDYVMTGARSYAGGSVTLVAALEAGETLLVVRDTPALQQVDLRNQGDFFPETYEDALDFITMAEQDSLRLKESAVRLDIFAGTIPSLTAAMSSLEVRKGKLIGFDASGNPTLLPATFVTTSLPDAPWVDIRGYASLEDAVTAIGGLDVALLIGAPTTVTTNLTVPDNIKMICIGGGSIGISAGKTLTINGPFEAGNYPVFSGTGAVAGLSEVRPEWFGAVGDGTTDCTTAIKRAIDSLIANRGGTVRFSEGTYRATKITMRNVVSLEGTGEYATILQPLASAEPYFIDLPSGPVISANIRKIGMHGGDINPTQWAIGLVASGGYSSGWWYSALEELEITGFNKGILIQGGATTADGLPMQFLVFKRVRVFRSTNDEVNGRCLKLVGQVGQLNIESCEFDGATSWTGTNIELVALTPGDTAAPGDISFYQTTIQTAKQAVTASAWMGDITFTNCWFEGIHQSYTGADYSSGISFEGTHFANAGSDGVSGDGYLVKFGVWGFLRFYGNFISGAFNKLIVGNPLSYGNDLTQNYIAGSPATDLDTTSTSTQITPAGTGIAATRNHTHGYVATTATPVITINSSLLPGAILSLWSISGPVTYATGGNITFGSALTPVVFPAGTVAQFLRTDTSGPWMLIAAPINAGAPVAAADVPNGGIFIDIADSKLKWKGITTGTLNILGNTP